MHRPQPGTPWGRIRTLAAIAVVLGSSACAPLRGDGSTRLAGCNPISLQHPGRQVIEADVANFVRAVPAAGAVRFEVQDCLMDGQLYDGKTIVLGACLARLPQPQRYFVIAHEFAHYRLDHQAQNGGRSAHILGYQAQPSHARDASELAHRTEFEADAYAVRMMRAQGLDPEDAARLFDSMGAGGNSATHPAFARRARAIRDVIAALAD